jgi:rhamnosyltransferase subunit B
VTAPAGKRIVFTTWGSFGDLHPFMALALELRRRGHQPAIATVPVYREYVEAAGVEALPLRPTVTMDDYGETQDLIRRVLDPADGPRFLFREVFGPALQDTYDDTLNAVTSGGGADLVVSHQVPLMTPLVVRKTAVRWASAVLLPMGFLSKYDPATAAQAPWMRTIADLHPILGSAYNALARAISNQWLKEFYRFRAQLGLDDGTSPVFEGQHSPRLVLALFSHLLAKKQPDYPTQTVVTGFAFYDGANERPAPPGLIEFLDAGEPPIVFTLGSSAVWIAQDFYHVSIEAARRLGGRALLLIGEFDQNRLGPLPDGIAAFPYAPHSLVMPRAAVVVHQGGVGTTGQALRSGRPMLVVPFGQDQPDNARRCQALGVARTIARGHYTLSRVTNELARLLDDLSYAERAAWVRHEVETEDGTAHACDEIERVLEEAR